MPLVLQHTLVIVAVAACLLFLGRCLYRALQGRKTRLSGCGVCSGCPTPAPSEKKSSERIVMVPMDALTRSMKLRTGVTK
jgi:hypothetical protein